MTGMLPGEVAATATPASAADRRAQVATAVQRFISSEAGSARLLLAATVVALVWANSPWAETYDSFWHTELSVRLADLELALDLKHWVNDGLMVFFFFVLGLEVKRELVLGELADWRRALVPFLAAGAGLVVPALVYVTLNAGSEAAGAWGVVISTDTAFLLGVLALVGPACPGRLRVFLLTLAVADDVGALAVIAVFYTDGLSLPWALGSLLAMAAMVLLRRTGVRRGPPYFVLATLAWVAMYESGIHPTIAGVLIAVLVPVFAPTRSAVTRAADASRAFTQSPNPRYARTARFSIDRSVSPNERFQLLYQPWSSLLIVPLFALANAGVTFDAPTVRAAATSPITLGILLALVVGKLVGIYGGATLAVRLDLGELAPGLSRLQLAGGAALSGIGFTISLFIVDLAFTDDELADQARIGVLAAAVVAVALGSALFAVATRRQPADAERPTRLRPPVDPVRDHTLGAVDAPLTLVEYGDFQCPFCGQATGSVREVRAHFGARLSYTYRHLPLVDTHPDALGAARAAEAAALQDAFWGMHDQLFADQDHLSTADLVSHAEHLGLDVDRFLLDLDSHRVRRHVEHHLTSAEASGAAGTPTFFVNGRRHTGPFDAGALITALEATAPADPVTPVQQQTTHDARPTTTQEKP